MDFAASFTLTSECRSCKMSPNRSSLDKSTSFCKTQLTKNVNDDLLDLKSLILSITHRETHLCRSFDITVHEKALDGVWFCHNRLFHVLLGIWTFNTFSCKHIMKYNSLLKLRMHQKKKTKAKIAVTAYLCCSLQRRHLNHHQRFLFHPQHILFHLRDEN